MEESLKIKTWLSVVRFPKRSVMEASLGHVGGLLQDFAYQLDLDHPDLDCLDDFFPTKFRQAVLDMLSDRRHSRLMGEAAGSILTLQHPRPVRNLRRFAECRGPIRLFARNEARQRAQARQSFTFFGPSDLTCFWDSQQDNFSEYENRSDNGEYYGFSYLGPIPAVQTLAKQLGCLLTKVWTDNSDRNSEYVRYPEKSLSGFSLPNVRKKNLKFAAFLCPAVLIPNLPDHVQDIIAFLEASPKAEHKPIFDNYWAVIPAFTCPHGAFVTPEGEEVTHRTPPLAIVDLGMRLLAAGATRPALLGRVDGFCYYLGQWRNAD